MEAIGYARISKSEKNSVSIEFQISEITKLARSNGYNLIDIHIDDGISGKSIKNRPGVQRVLEAVSNRSVDAVQHR